MCSSDLGVAHDLAEIIMSMTPAESDAFIRREHDDLGKVMRDAGLTPQ